MSVNKGVAAAQRKRTTTPQEQPRQRVPQPSINSSQMFGNQQQQPPQGRPAQQQYAQQQPNADEIEGIASISKMTIPQAITLITLRLGQTETRMQQLYKMQYEQRQGQGPHNADGNDNMILVDKEVIDSITQRLDELDQQTQQPSSENSQSTISSTDVALLKQQFETVKHVTSQNKIAMNSISKDYKQSIATFRKELGELKSQLSELQILMFDTSKQVLAISLGQRSDEGMDDAEEDEEENEEENEEEDEEEDEKEINPSKYTVLIEEGLTGDQ